MQICIIGTGYVGLVSGLGLAAKGHDVVCVDRRSDLVAALNQGRTPIYEPGLDELLRDALAAGRFKASTDLHLALAPAKMVIIAVGTPSHEGRIDLHDIREVATQIGSELRT